MFRNEMFLCWMQLGTAVKQSKKKKISKNDGIDPNSDKACSDNLDSMDRVNVNRALYNV